jgi:hypothetical protein
MNETKILKENQIWVSYDPKLQMNTNFKKNPKCQKKPKL